MKHSYLDPENYPDGQTQYEKHTAAGDDERDDHMDQEEFDAWFNHGLEWLKWFADPTVWADPTDDEKRVTRAARTLLATIVAANESTWRSKPR